MLLMPVRGGDTEREQRPSLEHIRTMSPSQMEKNNKTMSNKNYNSERGMHATDNNINHSRYNNILHNDIKDGAFDLDHDSNINNFPRLLESTSTAFPLLEDDDSLTLEMTHHHLQQGDETNLENTNFHQYDNNLNYYNAWEGLERSPSITLHNDITSYERHIRPEVNSREYSKLYGYSTYNKDSLCSSQVRSPLSTNKIVHVDKYNCSVNCNENESIRIGNSENNEYRRRNACDQHMTNCAGVTTTAVRSGLVQSVSRSIEREHSTDAIAPWKSTCNVESFDNLFHIRRRLQSRAFVWTSRTSNSQEEFTLTNTKTTHADFCYCNSLEKNKYDNSIRNISSNSTRSNYAHNYKLSSNSIGDSSHNNYNFDEIKSTWLNTLSLYHDQRSKNGLPASEENNIRQDIYNTKEKIKNIWKDKHDAIDGINHSVSEIQCNEDESTNFNKTHLTNYLNPHLKSTNYENKQQLSCTEKNVKSTSKEYCIVSKENGSKSTCERIKGNVVIISPPYSSSSNAIDDIIIAKPTDTNSINITTSTKTTATAITDKKGIVIPDSNAESNHTQEKEIISNTDITKIKDDSSSNNDEDLVSRPSEEQSQEEQMSTRELHYNSSAHLCDVEQEQTDDNIVNGVWDHKSINNNNIDRINNDDDDISEDNFTSSDEGADLSAPSWDDETFLASDERDELTTPPPSCSTAFVNYIYGE